MTATAVKATEPTQQDVCIDLPGETVQCWRSSDNIRVVLRKHRDVIFDLNLGVGKSYTVEASESDFYNARDKKLVYAKRHGVVTFKDGEHLHLWVTRNFKGALILKSGGDTLMKIVPNELDTQQYDDAPKTKPVPIIVALGSKSNTKSQLAPKGTKLSSSSITTPIASSAPVDDALSLVCVVEGTLKNMPEVVRQHFMKGGGASGLADIDPNEVATRNWIWGQSAGAVAFVSDNWSWLRASLDSKTKSGFRLVSAKVHLVKGKVRIYFSGFSKYNTVFGPGGFGPGHDRIMSIFGGAGKTSSTLAAAAKGTFATFKNNALISFVFGSVTAVAEWTDDVAKDGYDLAATLIVSVVKAVISALLTSVAVAFIVFAVMFFGTAALSVLVIGTLTVAIGIFANYIVEATDKELGKRLTGDSKLSDGSSAAMAVKLREIGNTVQRNWAVLSEISPSDYQGAPL
jgi:hypothetical protein